MESCSWTWWAAHVCKYMRLYFQTFCSNFILENHIVRGYDMSQVLFLFMFSAQASLQPGGTVSFEHRNLQGLNRSILGSVTTSNFLNPQVTFPVYSCCFPLICSRNIHYHSINDPGNLVFRMIWLLSWSMCIHTWMVFIIPVTGLSVPAASTVGN